MSLKAYAELARLDKPWAILIISSPILWSYLHALFTLRSKALMDLALQPDFADALRDGFSPIVGHVNLLTKVASAFMFWIMAVLLARSASCVINDWWDADFDKHVTRCKRRPIAHGDLTPLQGLAFYLMLVVVSMVFVKGCNPLTIKLWALQLFCGSIYPSSKRWCPWPQVVLALTFGLGSFTGWASVTGSLDFAATLPLFIASSAWCLLFDTIYALPDREYDLKLGLNSTTIQFQDNLQMWLSSIGIMSIAGFISSNAQHSYQQRLGSWIALFLIAIQYGKQIYTLNANDHISNSKKFSYNFLVGLMMTSGLLYDLLTLNDIAEMNVRGSSNHLNQLASSMADARIS